MIGIPVLIVYWLVRSKGVWRQREKERGRVSKLSRERESF